METLLSLGSHPTFGYSHTRHRALLACPRQYYYRWYGSWGGWKREAIGTPAHVLYRLKHITTPALAAGTLLHECAAHVANCLRAGKPVPSYDVLLGYVQGELRALLRRSLDDFWRDPKRNSLLWERFYRGRDDPRIVDYIEEYAPEALSHLLASTVWSEVAACRREDILIIDSRESTEFHGVELYAAPDLVYTTHRDQRITIVDWKTGRWTDGGREQVSLYALYVRSRFRRRWNEWTWRGRVVSLRGGTEEVFELTTEDMVRAYSRIESGVGAMEMYLEDIRFDAPVPESEFERVNMADPNARRACRECPFWGMCAPAIDPRGRGAAHTFFPVAPGGGPGSHFTPDDRSIL